MISNLTSDLDKYLIDMENSIICKDETIDSCKEALLRTLEIESEKYKLMRQYAYDTASNYFSYHVYSILMYNFIKKIRQ